MLWLLCKHEPETISWTINLFSSNLLFVRLFCHSSRNDTRSGCLWPWCLVYKWNTESSTKETALRKVGDSFQEHWSFIILQRRKACLTQYNGETTLHSGSLAFACPHPLVEDLTLQGSLLLTFLVTKHPRSSSGRKVRPFACVLRGHCPSWWRKQDGMVMEWLVTSYLQTAEKDGYLFLSI